MKKTAHALILALGGMLAFDCMNAAQSFADCYVLEPLPAVRGNYVRRDIVEPGVYEVDRRPSVYGWTKGPDGEPRRILLRPYKNYAHFQRPYIAWSRERPLITPEGHRWRHVRSKADCESGAQ